MSRLLKWSCAVAAGFLLGACKKTPVVPEALGYEILATLPHDRDAYTQGLQWVDGKLYESTGQKGFSSVRLVNPETGEVLRKRALPAEVFGEGLTLKDKELWVLTWREKTAFVLDAETFRTLRTFDYDGEGWGLTSDGKELIMSDGTDRLMFRSFKDFTLTKTVGVTDGGKPLKFLNELEYVNGAIFANVYMTGRIARIDPESGEVTGWLDLSGLRGKLSTPNRAEVLNGVARDPESGDFMVTGKWWPEMFRIRVK